MKYLIISITLFLTSCSEIYRVLDKTNRPREIINDKRVMTYSKSTNKFQTVAVTGNTEVDTLNLIPGEVFKISPETPYVLTLQNVDFSVYSLYSKYKETDDYVEIGVVRPTSKIIKLEKQCETIRWMDPYYLPKITVSEKLEVHQIVITPIMNSKCQKLGYEIRYGSQEVGGCKIEAKEVYDKYYNCIDRNKPIDKRLNLLDIIIE